MREISLFFILSALLISCAGPRQQAAPTATATAQPPSPELRRGVNIGNALEAPTEGAWGVVVREEYFDLIHEAGFDFVRLPIRWSAHAERTPPYTIDPAFFARVDEIVNWALERDLKIILDMHHYEEMATDPRGHEERFLALWEQIAEHYQGYPSGVIFELLNEPNGQLTTRLWNDVFPKALGVIRRTNPTRWVVVGPGMWNAYQELKALRLPPDPYLMVTFHYYLPFEFTHQGAEWVNGSDAYLGTTWEGTPAEQRAITGHMDIVADWARRQNVPVLLGEFGAYSKADMASRVRWTSFVREQAEVHGFAWCYWELAAGFGIYDRVAGKWRQELLKALIP